MPEWPFDPPITPMEAKVRVDFPEGEWAYERKRDGFRSVAWSVPVRLDSRNHKPLFRYSPELIPSLEALPAGTVVDGEVVVVTGDRLDFDALQNRLRPAESRVRLHTGGSVFEQLRAEDSYGELDGRLSYDAARTDLAEQFRAVVLRNHTLAHRG